MFMPIIPGSAPNIKKNDWISNEQFMIDDSKLIPMGSAVYDGNIRVSIHHKYKGISTSLQNNL